MSADYRLVVSIPDRVRSNDIRLAIARMAIGRTRHMRVENARRVLKSRSPHVTPDHKQLARRILDGSGDLLLRKGVV